MSENHVVYWKTKPKINFLRVDLKPKQIVADLCLASAQRVFNETKSGLIKHSQFTLKYTRSLHLQLYIRKPVTPSIFKGLIADIKTCLAKLNFVKKEKVYSFQEIRVINVQASGKFSYFSQSIWKHLRLPEDVVCELGTDHTEPSVPVKLSDICSGQLFRFIVLTYVSGNILKINNTGSFTIVCQDLEKYERLLLLTFEIAKQAQAIKEKHGRTN